MKNSLQRFIYANILSFAIALNANAQLSPIIDFEIIKSCAPFQVQFFDASLDSASQWQWSFPGSVEQTSTLENPIITYNNEGNFNVELTIFNAVGSGSILVTNLFNLQNFSIEAGPDIDVCIGDEIQLNINENGTVLWEPSTGLSNPNIGAPFFGGTSSQEYIVTVDNGNCIASDTIFVDVLDLPIINIFPNAPTTCPGVQVALNANGAQEYLWSPNEFLNDSATATVFAAPFSNTTYTVVGTDANGCKNSISTTVQVIQLLDLDLNGNEIVVGCTDELNEIVVNSSNNLTWSPSNFLNTISGNVVNINVPDADTLTYTIVETDNFGCSQQKQITYYALAGPEVTIEGNTDFCEGEQIELTASGANFYVWNSFDSIVINNPFVANTTVNAFQEVSFIAVSGTDNFGCSNSFSTQLTRKPLPIFEYSDSTFSFCDGAELILNIENENQYTALENEDFPNISNLDNGTYAIEITNIDNCILQSSFTIEKEFCFDGVDEILEIIPNVISPNNDGKNDIWKLEHALFNNYPLKNVSIHNRWGNLIFEADETFTGWNGEFKMKTVPTGTYYFLLSLDGIEETIKGTIVVLK